MTDRLAYPDAVLYEVNGKLNQLFPNDGTSYIIRVQDWSKYEALCQNGEMFHPSHTGIEYKYPEDNRKAPGV